MDEEVDQPVEDQTDRVLAAVALVVAEQVAASQGSDNDDSPVVWIPLLRATVGLVLDAFLVATLAPFVAGLRGTTVSRVDIQKYVEKAREQAVAQAAEIVSARDPEGDPSLGGRVARAMVLGARESARFEAARDAGAIYKVWRTRRDKRVRPTHGGLEGNQVPLGQPFVTAEGNSIQYPHDPAAPLSETAGCRCRLSYRVKKAAA